MEYDVQQVCLNGHQITAYYHLHPEDRKAYCGICGKETVHACQKCNMEIQGGGISWVNGVRYPAAFSSVSIPEFCKNCGKAFPWKERKKDLEISLDLQNSIKLIEYICTRFHFIVRQLRSRHGGRPTLDVEDEYDVQDLLHCLLKLHFDDIRPEECTPSYAGGCSRMDFFLKNESIAIEIKKTRKGLGQKELGDQLIIDKERFREHPSCKTLLCFVYDPDGKIPNPHGIENDLSCQEEDLFVKVLIVPKGY